MPWEESAGHPSGPKEVVQLGNARIVERTVLPKVPAPKVTQLIRMAGNLPHGLPPFRRGLEKNSLRSTSRIQRLQPPLWFTLHQTAGRAELHADASSTHRPG